jgi:UDP-N-acetylglucosamine 4-epimerase
MIAGKDIFINGDGETSRDFCFVDNVVQVNLLAATTTSELAKNQVFNVAVGGRTSLNQLLETIRDALVANGVRYNKTVHYLDFRVGDVRHSQADIGKAVRLLGYSPSHAIKAGIEEVMPWYIGFLSNG